MKMGRCHTISALYFSVFYVVIISAKYIRNLMAEALNCRSSVLYVHLLLLLLLLFGGKDLKEAKRVNKSYAPPTINRKSTHN